MLKFKQILIIYFLILIFTCGLSFFDIMYSVFGFLISTFAFVFLIIWGASKIHSQMFVKAYCSNRTDKNNVALTFDDGPDFKNTPEILDLLSEYNAKATFFCIGKKIQENTALTERVLTEGHLIGNHTFSHSNGFPIFKNQIMNKEISDCQEIIESLTGKANPYFRPPFGVTNPLIAKALAQFNLKTIGWSIRSLDTLNQDSSIVVKRVIQQIKGGDIILLHDTSPNIIAILKELLEYFKQKNIKPITVNELLSI